MTTHETNKLAAALQVLTMDAKIRAWLAANDPKALRQAQTALEDAGFPSAPALEVTVVKADRVLRLRKPDGAGVFNYQGRWRYLRYLSGTRALPVLTPRTALAQRYSAERADLLATNLRLRGWAVDVVTL